MKLGAPREHGLNSGRNTQDNTHFIDPAQPWNLVRINLHLQPGSHPHSSDWHGGWREKTEEFVWSLLNNPGHCPAPPKAAHSITFSCPHTQVTTLPLLSPAISQVPRSYSHRLGTLQSNETLHHHGQSHLPILSVSPSQSQEETTEQVWMDGCRMYVPKKKKRSQNSDISVPELFSQNSIFGRRKGLLLLVTPSSAPSRLGKQASQPPSRALLPTHSNPVYVSS